ncbi:MAG: isoprenylcysteine carboxylmethyltransferase family protein [Candidatus Omnitrophota bacterium]|jgi:protein-S-isoprenylcysteine O-methyltransferase Ste14|nr:MAG: isoprenylcysteine carboxylmethyltransferase family protein [Candidatus Omnitrophota bacterium]
MKMRIRIQGILIFASVLLTLVLYKLILPSWKYHPTDELFDALGIGLILFGFLFRVSSRGYKEEMSSNGFKLVTGGPYKMVRNPMYLGTLLIGSGVVLMIFRLWMLFIFLAVYLMIYIPQINKEDKILKDKFKDDYYNYCRSTPKYFPSFSSLFNLNYYLKVKFSWVKKEAISLAMVMATIIAIEVFEDIKLFGYPNFINEIFEFLFIFTLFLAIIRIFFYANILRD